MLTKTITYTDYNGEERTEDFLFNLKKSEIMEMELGKTGGLAEHLQRIVKAQNTPEIVKEFKELILKAYGETSADGKRFIKVNDAGVPLSIGFEQTEAYSELFMELSTNAEAAAAFVNGIVPADMKPDMNASPALASK